jgi:hypothetical protein
LQAAQKVIAELQAKEKADKAQLAEKENAAQALQGQLHNAQGIIYLLISYNNIA